MLKEGQGFAVEVNGIAHIFLSVRNYEECAAFYRQLLPAIGLTFVVRDNPDSLYCIGGRTGFGIARAEAGLRDVPFTQGRPGLHHVCFRARSREDVDFVHQLARKLGAKIIHAPDEGQWAPGTIRSCSKIPTVSASKSISFPARAC